MQNTMFSEDCYLDFHTHRQRHAGDDKVLEIVSLHLGQDIEREYFTIGMHPWWTQQPINAQQHHELIDYLSDPRCLAMGEMGLDNLKGPDMNTQMEILRSLLPIAQQLGKPVVIHCVRAYGQLMEIKKEYPGIEKWCVHGYGRHATLAKQLIDQGFYLSIMPAVPDTKYAEFFKTLPPDRLFLETDSMPNETIKEVYLRVSKAVGISIPDLCRQMNYNAKEFFSI